MERNLAQVAMAQARASGSWRTIVAPPGEHRPLQAIGAEMLIAMLAEVRKAFAASLAASQSPVVLVRR